VVGAIFNQNLASQGRNAPAICGQSARISGLTRYLYAQKHPEDELSKRLAIALLLTVIGLALLLPVLKSNAKPESGPSAPRRPKLIVVLIIDQFPYNYLVRFRPYFVNGGFNLLLEGANFVDCRYDYAITATCPGHAALATGAYPDINGIVGNDWYDRVSRKQVNCVRDDSTRLVGASEGVGRSPALLLGDTFTDELRQETGFKSRVVSISLKDRGAIIPGGHTANAAYWYDASTGHFVTSTYYLPSLPAWASRFNGENAAKAYCSKSWQALPETPAAGGKVLERFPGDGNEPCPNRRFLSWLNDTPFMSEIQLDFARQAVEGEHLGQGPSTDVLAISLSENDYVGHRFGPNSPEVADMTLRTDRDLAQFFAYLDQKIGLDNVWITLSADHGVAPTPAFIEEHKLGPGRVSQGMIAEAINKALSSEFGQGRWVAAGAEFQIYLDQDALEKAGIDLGRAEFSAAKAAASVPFVAAAFTRSQLITGNLPATPLARKAAKSFNPARGGDIFLILEPYAVPIGSATGTTHGSPWSYDAQVPLIFWGSAFKPGTNVAPVEPIDLPATLAAALGLGQPSGSQGKPLRVALK
jgi:predicted AlkP superfamily pyrophosphatase or phosphodiesterase